MVQNSLVKSKQNQIQDTTMTGFLNRMDIKPDVEFQKWKEQKREAKSRMIAMQYQPYDVKKKRSELRAIEFLQEMDKRGKTAHVSVGGLDSINMQK